MENTLAENIRFFRRERKMTQEQLAEALGLTVGTIYKWEKDLSTPDIGLIMDMAELFGTSTDVLLGYQWQTGNAGRALARIQTLTQEKRYAEAVAEAEKALRKYPNHFEIVYHSALAYLNLSFRYGEKPVLENASFRFDQGGKYALTGPSGCGKSTLLKLLLGWLPDYSGTIRFDGRDARDLTPEQLQRQMSYIEQDVFLFNTTIRENITLGDAFSEEALAQAVRDSALEGDLANMPQGLDTPVGEDGGNLSGGQKQRVAIARALLHRRSILLVDEGTSALDQKNADIVEQSLLENPDLTLILVSHHLSPARKAQFTKVYQLSPAELCTT